MTNILVQVFTVPLTWFYNILVSCNMLGFYLSAIMIFLIGRFILVPLAGGSFIGANYHVKTGKIKGRGAGWHMNNRETTPIYNNSGGGGSSRGGGSGRR